MNYLATIDELNSMDTNYKRHILVSGTDKYVHDKVFKHYASAAVNNNIILIDFGADMGQELNNQFAPSYTIVNFMEAENLFSNPLRDVKTLMGKSNIRFLADCLGFDEYKKGKLIKYLEIINRLLEIEAGDNTRRGLLLKELHQFSTNRMVNEKFNILRSYGKITDDEYEDLINNYCEVSDVAADFENAFLILEPLFVDDSEGNIEKLDSKHLLYVPLGMLSQDLKLQETIVGLLLYSLKMSKNKENFLVILNDVGQGATNAIYNLLITLPPLIEKICFTEDVFAMCGDNNLGNLLNKFETQLFTRHNQMLSCEKLEGLGGEVKTVYQSSTVTHDYRISANSVLDMLLQRDKTEAYTSNPPVWEKRFRKEDIAEFNMGTFLLWQNGNMSLCNL